MSIRRDVFQEETDKQAHTSVANRIYGFLAGKNAGYTQKEIEDYFHMPAAQVNQTLRKLIDAGKTERKKLAQPGRRKTVYYYMALISEETEEEVK